jgi:RNA polymerase sigma factor (sigma-70 family)
LSSDGAAVRAPGLRDGHGRWRRELLRCVHRLTGDPDLAEDVAQEALMRLERTDPDGKIQNPRAWLFRVATNLVRDAARREETARRLAPPPPPDGPPTPAEELERAESVRQVRRALERLSPRDRELLMMRESGFRYAEIADVLGVKTESVATLARRALDRFRAAYLEETEHAASN